jgi:hypothetical protein
MRNQTKYLLLFCVGVLIAGVIGISAFLVRADTSSFPKTSAQVLPFADSTPETQKDLKIKGNKNSKIYHLPGCASYDRISDKNIVWFKTKEEAEAAGYRMAKNC